MNFYFLDNFNITIKNDELYILLDNHKYNSNYNNLIIPYDGIFTYNNEDENDFYLNVASRMRKAGFNGFLDWISKCINEFSNHIYYDNNDRPIKYKSVVFITKNSNLKKYIKSIFNNFGFIINDYHIKNENVLF